MNKFIPNFTEFVNEDFDNLKNTKTIGMDAKKYMAKQPVEQILEENQLLLQGLVSKYFSDNLPVMKRYHEFASSTDPDTILKLIRTLENTIDNDLDKNILYGIKLIFKRHLGHSDESDITTDIPVDFK